MSFVWKAIFPEIGESDVKSDVVKATSQEEASHVREVTEVRCVAVERAERRRRGRRRSMVLTKGEPPRPRAVSTTCGPPQVQLQNVYV